MIPEHIRSIVARLPQDLTPRQKDHAHLMTGAGFVYGSDWKTDESGKKRRYVKVTCSECRNSYGADTVPEFAKEGIEDGSGCMHDSWRISIPMMCPICGATGKAVRGAYINGFLVVNSRNYVTMLNLDGRFIMLVWLVTKEINRSCETLYFDTRYEGIILDGKKLWRIASTKNGFYSNYCEWLPRAKFEDRIGVVYKRDIDIDADAINLSNAEKTGLLDLFRNVSKVYPVSYLQLWKKHPNVENLVKAGLAEFVGRIVDDGSSVGGCYYSNLYCFSDERSKRVVDWSRRKPHEMLGIQKEEMYLIAGMTPPQFYLYRIARKHGEPDDEPGISWYDIDNLEESVIRGNPISKIMRYVRRQGSSTGTYRDYVNLLLGVYGGDVPDDRIFPKDLQKEHDRLTDIYKFKKDEILDANIRRRLDEVRKYEFSDQETGMMIVPVTSQQDLIDEGKALKHCVATYAESYAKKKTTILFVRKIEEPDKPFYTLEWKNEKIIQDHGRGNALQTPLVLEFEKHWLAYISQKKGAEKNGKRYSERV